MAEEAETFDDISRKYYLQLNKEAKSRNKILKLVDYPGDLEEQVQNPTLNDLKSLRHVFISKRAHKNIERVQEACSMVGRDSWDDCIAMTNTHSSYLFHQIFRVELKLCSELLKKSRWDFCLDSLVALLFAFESRMEAFYDTEDGEDAQQILNDFCCFWKQVMKNKDYETEIVSDGYIRTFAKESNLSISITVRNTIKKWCVYMVPLDSMSRKVLYGILKGLQTTFASVNYTFDYGDYTNDVIEDDYIGCLNSENEEKTDESEPRLSYNELKAKKVKELKKMCKERMFSGSGKKDELIWKLLQPKRHISELKRKYHYQVFCKRNFYFPRNMPRDEVQDKLCWMNQFAEDKYIFENGKIKKNGNWNDDMRVTNRKERIAEVLRHM